MHILQHVITPIPGIGIEEALAFRKNRETRFSLASDRIEFDKEGYVEFDTFFNLFSAEKWRKLTTLKELGLSLRLSGKFRITILHKHLRNREVISRVISESFCDTEKEQKEVHLPVTDIPEEGIVSFSLVSEEDDGVFYGGYYYTEDEVEIPDEIQSRIISTFEKVESLSVERLEKQTELLVRQYPASVEPIVRTFTGSEKLFVFNETIFRLSMLLACLQDEYRDMPIEPARFNIELPWKITNPKALWTAGSNTLHICSLDARFTDQCMLFESRHWADEGSICICGLGLWCKEYDRTLNDDYVVLQRIPFPDPKICTSENMFFRRSGITSYSFSDEDVRMEDGGVLLNNTFFGTFSAGVWKKNTDLKKIGLKLTVKGNFRISLLHHACLDRMVNTRTVGEFFCDTRNVKQDIFCETDLEEDTGYYSFMLLSLSNRAAFYGAEYYTNEKPYRTLTAAAALKDLIREYPQNFTALSRECDSGEPLCDPESIRRAGTLAAYLRPDCAKKQIRFSNACRDNEWFVVNEDLIWNSRSEKTYDPGFDARSFEQMLLFENLKREREGLFLSGLVTWRKPADMPRPANYLVLQHSICPDANICTEESMFFRRFGNTAFSLSDEDVRLDIGGVLSTDTYFGGFSAFKWKKYTKVKRLGVKLTLKGSFRITLMHAEKFSADIKTKIVGELFCDTRGLKKDVYCEYNYTEDQGMYYFSILSLVDGSRYYGSEYFTITDENVPEKVRLAINICTFKREEYVYKNITSLKKAFLDNEISELKGHLEVLISDNASSLDAARIAHEDVHLVTNKNAGGTAGFTRGMIEAIKRNKNGDHITHIQMMDDDIVMEPEAIFRTYRILTMLKDEYKDAFIGGAMFRTDLQWFQTEAGAAWDSGRIVSRKCGLDARTLDACLYNDFEEQYEYNAWWYCTVPMTVVREDNLPVPIFIRGDDVEFGLRNMKHLILMNGICVWHLPFEFKYSSSMYYYIFRNRLIDNAVNNKPYGAGEFLSEFRSWFYRETFTLRYKNAWLLLEGAYDFLKGPDWLLAQDGEQLNKEVMAKGYKLQNADDLPVGFSYVQYEETIRFIESKKDQRKRKLTLNGMYQKPYKTVVVPVLDVHIAHLYRAKYALNYDLVSKKGFVTEFDREEQKKLLKAFRQLKKDVKGKYESAWAEFSARKSELTNLDFWNRYLGMDNK